MKRSVFLLVAISGLTLGAATIFVIMALRAEPVLRLVGDLGQAKTTLSATTVAFELQVVDAGNAGDCKMVGDIDGDGNPDLILGGSTSEKLNWYRYPEWTKTVIAAPAIEFTTDGAAGDVDGDGDVDIVVPDGNTGSNLLWFENPRPDGNPQQGSQWVRHVIGALGDWGKDVELADFDGNGRLDVAVRTTSTPMVFFQTAADLWSKTTLTSTSIGEEGMGSGDINADGHVDLVLQGVWLRNPGGTAARSAASWQEFAIGAAHPAFKTLVVDLNRDGHQDVLFSSSEATAPVEWWSPSGGNPTGAWIKHTILPFVERAHTLQAADMDLDGDLDVVLGQMHTSQDKELMILYNDGGQATAWSVQVVDSAGLHNGVVADLGADGDYDIYGANWTGNPPVRVWINQLDPAPGWTYINVSATHSQTFGLNFGDLDDDGRTDILSGPYWYKNPGGNLTGEWKKSEFPAGMHAILAIDADVDGREDVIAQKGASTLDVYWLKASNTTASAWNAVKIGSVEPASHTLGAQGYRVGQLEAGGKPEVVVSSGNGIYYFKIPSSPGSALWTKIHVSERPSDEGFALGDLNADGAVDIAATTGESLGVEWYENPGDGSANWEVHPIGVFTDAVFPDRTEIADLNGDGRLDVIVTEENGEASGAETYWWEQPLRSGDSWTPHKVVTQATTNSLDVADFDRNGTPDLALGEHRGLKQLTVWLNDGHGRFTRKLISATRESHLGAQAVDLDRDGDLDLVSIAWDNYTLLHLWRNDSGGPGPSYPNRRWIPYLSNPRPR